MGSMKRFGEPTRWLLGALAGSAAELYLFPPWPQQSGVDRSTGKPRTVVTAIGRNVERDRQLWDAIEIEFERDHPEIDRTVITSGGTQRKLDTRIAGGVAPEINSDGAYRYIDADALVNLAPYVAVDAELQRDLTGGTDSAGQPVPPDYFEFTHAAFQCGESLYALPTCALISSSTISKTLFDKYGVPYPDEDWDWRGLRERAIALIPDRQGRPVRIPIRNADGRAVLDERGRIQYPNNPAADNTPYDFGFSFAHWQHWPKNFIHQNNGHLLADPGSPTERVEIDVNARGPVVPVRDGDR